MVSSKSFVKLPRMLETLTEELEVGSETDGEVTIGVDGPALSSLEELMTCIDDRKGGPLRGRRGRFDLIGGREGRGGAKDGFFVEGGEEGFWCVR